MAILLYIGIGLAVGSVSGVMGIGGGVLLVPALIWLCGMKPHQAAGTSLAILIPPIGLPAAWRAYHANHVNLEAALWIAGTFCIGAYASRSLVDYIPEMWFRLGFSAIMILVALRMMIGPDHEAASAAAGLTSACLALLMFWGLKMLGLRNLTKPDLGKTIATMHEQGHGQSDYQI